VLELVDRRVADAQRVDDDLVGELDVVEAAERRGVLVLGAAGDLQVLALEPVASSATSYSVRSTPRCWATTPITATITALDEPRPDPGGAFVWMKRSKPVAWTAPGYWRSRAIVAFGRSSWPSSSRSSSTLKPTE